MKNIYIRIRERFSAFFVLSLSLSLASLLFSLLSEWPFLTVD